MAANTSIIRAFVMRAKASAKRVEAAMIVANLSRSLVTKYCTTTEQTGSRDATTVTMTRKVAASRLSSYSHMSGPMPSSTGSYGTCQLIFSA